MVTWLPRIAILFLAYAVAGADSTNRYEYRAIHDRDGIGKFYLGREIAHVMGHQAADWLERMTLREATSG